MRESVLKKMMKFGIICSKAGNINLINLNIQQLLEEANWGEAIRGEAIAKVSRDLNNLKNQRKSYYNHQIKRGVLRNIEEGRYHLLST